MRIVKQPNGVYAVAFRDPRVTQPGKNPWRTVSLRTKDEREAQSNLQEWLAEQNRQKATLYTIGDLWELFLPTLRGKPSEKSRQTLWKRLSPTFAHLICTGVTQELITGYVGQRSASGVSSSTIRAELKLLRRLLNWSYAKGHLADRPPHHDIPRANPPRDMHLTREEFSQLLDKVEEHHTKLFLVLAVTTAARMTALLELTWDRIDFTRKQINLRNEDQVARKGRAIVPMNRTAERVLKAAKERARTAYVIEYGGHKVKQIGRSIRTAAVAAGVPWVTPHVLRHTAAVWMAESRVPMSEISQYLGHANSRITERVYARYSPAYLAHAASALEIENA